MGRGRGLADAALEIRHRHDLGRQILRAPGQVFLGAGSFLREMRPKPQHLIQREPFRPAFGFAAALGQIRVLLQDAAEMLGGHGDQIFRDLPGREEPELLAALGIHAPAREIRPPPCAGIRNTRKLCRVDRPPKFRQRRIGADVEIGGLLDPVPCHSGLMFAVFRNIHRNGEHQSKCRTSRSFSKPFLLFSVPGARLPVRAAKILPVLSLCY